jgi:hypothetical protein
VPLNEAKAGESDYWNSVLAVHPDNPAVSTKLSLEERMKRRQNLTTRTIGRLKEQPGLRKIVRTSVMSDRRTWVRTFSAIVLLKAFDQEKPLEDYVVILSDPEQDVRGFGVVFANVNGAKNVASCLGASLLRNEPAGRYSALNSLRVLLGWKGLPYYSFLLNDEDADIASLAARAFQSCKKDHARLHLLRYLEKHGQDPQKKPVTKEVLKTLSVLYGDIVPRDDDLGKTVDSWKKELSKSVQGDKLEQEEGTSEEE